MIFRDYRTIETVFFLIFFRLVRLFRDDKTERYFS